MTRFGDGGDRVKCSFCGKPQKLVQKLIAGPDVFICNDCVQLCADIVAEDSGVNTTTEERDVVQVHLSHAVSAPIAEDDESRAMPVDIDEALSRLDEPEREILRYRFGLDAAMPRSLAEVGNRFGMTREQVRLIEARAMSALGHHPTSPASPPVPSIHEAEVTPIGSRWSFEVVRSGRGAERVAEAYRALSALLRRQGLELDDLNDDEIIIRSIATDNGPGIRLLVVHRIDPAPPGDETPAD